jgi:hypothetical protein
MKNPAFDQTNPAFRSKFASLAAVRNEVIPAWSAQGISVIQSLTTSEAGVGCETILLHKSGQYMTFGPFTVPVGKRDAWSVASAATYAKRVSLQAVAVVVGDDDDDGAAVQESHTVKPFNDRSGRPDTSAVDPELKEQYAQGFINALLRGEDDKIMDLHHELAGQAELYTAVSDSLSSKQRTDLRAIISAHKKPKAAA